MEQRVGMMVKPDKEISVYILQECTVETSGKKHHLSPSSFPIRLPGCIARELIRKGVAVKSKPVRNKPKERK